MVGHSVFKKMCIGMLACALSIVAHTKDTVATYEKTCAACHDSGALNAPKKGDKATWNKLKSQKGIDNLVKNTRQGLPQMPAMGLCRTCSDDDFRALIDYMSQ